MSDSSRTVGIFPDGIDAQIRVYFKSDEAGLDLTTEIGRARALPNISAIVADGPIALIRSVDAGMADKLEEIASDWRLMTNEERLEYINEERLDEERRRQEVRVPIPGLRLVRDSDEDLDDDLGDE